MDRSGGAEKGHSNFQVRVVAVMACRSEKEKAMESLSSVRKNRMSYPLFLASLLLDEAHDGLNAFTTLLLGYRKWD